MTEVPRHSSKISPARIAAYDVLFRVATRREFTSTLLPDVEKRLQPIDRGLCHELVLGTLRRQIYLDRVIDELAGGKRLDIEVRVILRLSIFQLAFLERIPAHAAVNDAVTLTNRVKKSSARGLVNAVLRKASRGLPELAFADEFDRISVETSHPRWLIERWANAFGVGEAAAVAAANNQTPVLAFRRTHNGREIDLGGYKRSDIADGCCIADSFDAELRRMSDAGLIYFQDEGSQLVADAVTLDAGERFLDVCAAPGGKTTTIAGKVDQGLIVAGDITDRRVRLLGETCAKQGLAGISIVQYDAASSLPFADGAFDAVFVDAPCTGTGTIRHNPEIRYFVEQEDLVRLPEIQLAIVMNAAKLVRPGGRLIYATCSLETEENELVADAFLQAHPRFRATPAVVPERFLTAEGHARTRPDRDETDGFFIAAFTAE